MEGTAINQAKEGSNNISNNDVKRHPFDSTISSWGSDESSTAGFSNKAFDMLNSLRADIGQFRKDNEAVKTENKLLLEKNNTLTAKVDTLQAQNGELLARLKTVELLVETKQKLDSEQLKAHVEEQDRKMDAQLELMKGKMAEESEKLQKEFRKLTLENQQKYSGLQMKMADKNKQMAAQLEQQQMMMVKQQQQKLDDDINSIELRAKVATLENQMATMRMDAPEGPQVQQQQDQQQQDLDFADENNIFVDHLMMNEAVAKKGEDEVKEKENEEESEDDSPSSEEEDEDDTEVDDEEDVDDDEEGNDEAVEANEEADDDEEGEEEHGNGKEEKKHNYRGFVVALLSDVQPPRTVTSRKREFTFMDVTMESCAALKANVLSRFGYHQQIKRAMDNCDQITMYCYGCPEHKSCRNNGHGRKITCANPVCMSALLARKTDKGRFHLYRSGPHTCIRARKENNNDVAGGSQQQQHDNNSRGAGDRGVGGMPRGAAKKTTTPHRR